MNDYELEAALELGQKCLRTIGKEPDDDYFTASVLDLNDDRLYITVVWTETGDDENVALFYQADDLTISLIHQGSTP
jgi:hypothetical protein